MSRTKNKVLCGVSPVVKCMFKCHVSIDKYWLPYLHSTISVSAIPHVHGGQTEQY